MGITTNLSEILDALEKGKGLLKEREVVDDDKFHTFDTIVNELHKAQDLHKLNNGDRDAMVDFKMHWAASVSILAKVASCLLKESEIDTTQLDNRITEFDAALEAYGYVHSIKAFMMTDTAEAAAGAAGGAALAAWSGPAVAKGAIDTLRGLWPSLDTDPVTKKHENSIFAGVSLGTLVGSILGGLIGTFIEPGGGTVAGIAIGGSYGGGIGAAAGAV